MAPERRKITGDALAQLEETRTRAKAEFQNFINAGPGESEVLARLAWFSGSFGDIRYPFHPRLRELINHARDARFTWREIAQALGEGDSDADVRRVREKQEWRNRVYDEMHDQLD